MLTNAWNHKKITEFNINEFSMLRTTDEFYSRGHLLSKTMSAIAE